MVTYNTKVSATMDTYVKDAGSIWSDFRNRLKNDAKFRGLDIEAQLDFYQRNHNRFAMAFPIVLRYMIQLRSYSKKAFVKFVAKLQANPYHSELEYCERQADYVKYLYMELSPDHNTRAAQETWQNAYDMLAKEVAVFKEAEEKVKQKLEENNSQNSIEKRRELKALLNVGR